MRPIKLRRLAKNDGSVAADVFFDAVQNGTADVYSAEQRNAWAGTEPNPIGWSKRFENASGFVAEADGLMVGFMTLDANGHIDLAYVRPKFSGCGIGRLLYEQVETKAAEDGTERFTTEASKKARPFFTRLGWQVDQEQIVVRNGVDIVNFKMSTTL